MINRILNKVKYKYRQIRTESCPEGLRLSLKRLQCDNFYRKHLLKQYNSDRYILVEGLWDNPNHWNRAQMVSHVLREKYEANLIGLLPPSPRWLVKRSLKSIGAQKILDLFQDGKFAIEAEKITREILASAPNDEDFLALRLPGEVPASRLYDTILKRQRRESIDLKHPQLFENIHDFLQACLNGQDILNNYNIKALVLSHTISVYHSALAWLGLKMGLPVYIMDNLAGSIRCSHLKSLDDYYSPIDSPDLFFRNNLRPSIRKELVNCGKSVLKQRFSGNVTDLSGKLSFGGNKKVFTKKELCEYFKFDPAKPIVCIMMCNWCDFPHTFGMENFTNIADWILFTIQTISPATEANWLIKSHPAEHRYGGPSIEEKVGELPRHIRIFPHEAHPVTIIEAIDAIVTPYGSAGMEYAAMGKSVLLADKSFYSNWGFCQVPTSRLDYARRLLALPHLPPPGVDIQENAFLFIALLYGIANEANGYIYQCDTGMYELFDSLPDFLRANQQNIVNERLMLRDWMETGLKSYNSYKIARFFGMER